MEELLSTTLATRRLWTWLLILIAVFAVLLSAAGVYCTVAYSVARRTSEIGIRIALGADRSRVRSFVMLEAMKPVLAGTGISILICLGWVRILAALLVQISPTDPLT